MEGRVKVGDILRFRQGLGAEFDYGEGTGIVQGGQVGQVLEIVVGLGVNDMRVRVVASVDDAVAGVRDVVLAR